MQLSFLLVAAGIALLYGGGEALVSGSVRLARAFGLSRLVIGLTVVAFATSAPELAATLTAALRDSPDMAVGNVIGSNVANLGLILGLTAIFLPLVSGRRFIRREVLFMTLMTALVYPLMLTGLVINRLEGIFLVVLLGLFVRSSLRDAEHRAEGAAEASQGPQETRPPLGLPMAAVALGVALLVGGAQLLVAGATDIAAELGVSERVIGLTLVALGTSLPELAASLVAARRDQGDIVLGNVIGSNIFNLLSILGMTSLVQPIAVAPAALGLDFWVMLGITLLVLAMLLARQKLGRWEGVVLLSLYVGYTVFLLLPG